MKFDIVDPFVDSLISVCDKLGIKVVKDKVIVKTGKKVEYKFSFYFKIKGDFKGMVVYEVSERLSKEIIRRLYQIEDLPADDEVLISGIAEFGNIVNSNLVETLYNFGKDFSISYPIFSKSKGRIISYSSPCVEVSFASEFGKLILSIIFESSKF
jgi:CheY-specific phosphatase CheX